MGLHQSSIRYTVEFDSNELIRKAIDSINQNMFVARLQYTVTKGHQTTDLDAQAIARERFCQ
jgi:type III restriction enzyme